MIILHGIAVSPGIAIGKVLIFDSGGFQVARITCPEEDIPQELARFDEALERASEQIGLTSVAATEKLGKQYGAIFEAHLQMLHDEKLLAKIRSAISVEHLRAESAVVQVFQEYAAIFHDMQNEYLAQRANDMTDLEQRLLRVLRHEKKSLSLKSPAIIFAHDLTPSETAAMDPNLVQAMVTEVGGPTSHTAIVAEAMQIPAVVGVGGELLTRITSGDQVIVDGDRGSIIINPDDQTLDYYTYRESHRHSVDIRLRMLRDLPATTADGVDITLLGNIEFPIEAKNCLESGAEGIGLYRTEFLYLSGDFPGEEDHYNAYEFVCRTMADRPVTIRTVDLGADKLLGSEEGWISGGKADYITEHEKNPGLGLRSIRLSLSRLDIFRQQLRAILRVSAKYAVKIMFPLVSTVLEFQQAKMILEDVKEDLREENIPFAKKIDLGVMVEVPSTVLMIEHFAAQVDFLSIGTNDLTQYALAVDRTNRDVVHLFNPCDPAVLKLIHMTMEGVRHSEEIKERHVPVSLCGQMGGNPVYTMLLLGLGLRTLSISPRSIPEVKNICRGLNLTHCKAVAQRALLMEKADEVMNYLKSELRKVFPDPDDLLD